MLEETATETARYDEPEAPATAPTAKAKRTPKGNGKAKAAEQTATPEKRYVILDSGTGRYMWMTIGEIQKRAQEIADNEEWELVEVTSQKLVVNIQIEAR